MFNRKNKNYKSKENHRGQKKMDPTDQLEDIEITILPTPNPNALKFVVGSEVKRDGKSSFTRLEECENIPLAYHLMSVAGVESIHFFQNVVTVSKVAFEEWDFLETSIVETIKKYLPSHDADFVIVDPETERRKSLSPELLKIEEILDRTVRPGLQGDGGDLTCLSYEDNILVIRYEGACGTCPSSTTGTLEAIKGILRDQYDSEIEVYLAPATTEY